jgi:tRNA threonylcarbamoyladenosine biosynthesis protein TsaE
MMKNIILADENETQAFGARLAALCLERCVIFLQGDLGAGKTTLVRGFLRGLGHTGAVKSPTYTLVEPYEVAGRQIFHFDLYRLKDPQELVYMGIRDYFAEAAVCLIEWPERAAQQLPEADLTCYIRSLASGRRLTITASTAQGQRMLTQLPN